MAIPLGVAILFLMGVGPALPWGRGSAAQARRALLPPMAGGVVVLATGFLGGARSPWALVTLLFAGFALQVTLMELGRPIVQRWRGKGEGLGAAFGSVFGLGRRRLAAYVIHAGAIVLIVGVAISGSMGVSREKQLMRGESLEVGHYTLTFLGADVIAEPHREAIVARVGVKSGDRDLGVLEPRMNQYASQREPVGTPAVRSSLFEDLYLSVMNVDPGRQTLGLSVFVKPMVGWIWGAMIIMALGGFAAVLRPRQTKGARP
jgi:cytochrome c-type biogenesis protein CcmF